MKIILLLILMLFNIVFAIPFERYFKKYTKHYFKRERINYLWFVAQAKQESLFDSLAISPVGAFGVMQIMPDTWKDLTKNIFNIASPKYNIKYGIKYNKKMWNIYKQPRPEIDRLSFMFGSYNAGAGNIIKSQKKAIEYGENPNRWVSIEKTLHTVTGKHSRETITYVCRIKKHYRKLLIEKGRTKCIHLLTK